jgi:hypothetical protein
VIVPAVADERQRQAMARVDQRRIATRRFAKESDRFCRLPVRGEQIPYLIIRRGIMRQQTHNFIPLNHGFTRAPARLEQPGEILPQHPVAG